MITLKYQSANDDVLEIQEKLKELSLGFQEEQGKKNPALSFVDGDTILNNKKEILLYLEQLGGELHSRYYCNC